jgi:hypothetical protein
MAVNLAFVHIHYWVCHHDKLKQCQRQRINTKIFAEVFNRNALPPYSGQSELYNLCMIINLYII